MVEPNNISEFSSNYVLSTTPQMEVTATGSKAIRNHRTCWPTITSMRGSSMESSHVTLDVPSDLSSNPDSPNTCPRNGEVSAENVAEPLPRSHQLVFKFNALCVQVLLYPIALVIYLLVGAALFTAIEHDYQNTARNELEDAELKNELQRAVEDVLRRFNVSESTYTRTLTTHFCTDNSSVPNQWDFLPSFYFAATIITTIGEVL